MSKIEDIDFSRIVFSKTKVKSANKFLYVYYDKKPLVLKFPKTRLPFGINKDSLSQKKQYILDISLEDHPDYIKKLEELDDFIIQKVKEDFYPDKEIEELKNMYVSCLKNSNNVKYSPTFRSKIITDKEEKIKCDFYESNKDENGKYPKISFDKEGGEGFMILSMQKNKYVETITECIGLWFMNDRFGLSFKTYQVKIYFEDEEEKYEFLESDDSTSNSDAEFI